MRKELDNLEANLQYYLDQQEDYETQHEDSGSAYHAALMRLNHKCLRQELHYWLEDNTELPQEDIDNIDYQQLIDDLYEVAEMLPGNVYSSPHSSQFFTLASYPVGELEIQIEPEVFVDDGETLNCTKMRLLYLCRSNNFCMQAFSYYGERQPSSFFAYVNTDATWRLVAHKANIIDCIADQL